MGEVCGKWEIRGDQEMWEVGEVSDRMKCRRSGSEKIGNQGDGKMGEWESEGSQGNWEKVVWRITSIYQTKMDLEMSSYSKILEFDWLLAGPI